MQNYQSGPDVPPSYEYATSTTNHPANPAQQTRLPAYPGEPAYPDSYQAYSPQQAPTYAGAYPNSYQAYSPQQVPSYAGQSSLPGPLGHYGHPGMDKVAAPPLTVQYVANPTLTDEPAHLMCPNCHTSVTTRTSTTTQDSALGWALCLFCFCWPLMWLPCVMCRKTTHSCPNCNYVVGKYKSG